MWFFFKFAFSLYIIFSCVSVFQGELFNISVNMVNIILKSVFDESSIWGVLDNFLFL